MVDPLEDAWLAGLADGFGFVTVAFLVAAFFFGAAFFAAGFAGIGMVMPGMCICADAGPGRVASANALTATVRILFTN